MPYIPRVVVSGLRGGSGKTTLAVGLAAALRDLGIRVSAFKKGPDYIDAGWLAAATGEPCRNLDPYLIGEENVLRSFISHSVHCGFAVIEGNRGLFDGMDAKGSLSTARLARAIKAPVILVVDCTKATRTVAAMVLGARRFERGVHISGVVLSMVATSRQEALIREAVEEQAGVPVIGAIPRLKDPWLPERHMGLVTSFELKDAAEAVGRAAEIVRRYVDLERAMEAGRRAPRISLPRKLRIPEPGRIVQPLRSPRIGVLRDPAFQFYYPENIEELKRRGATVVELSALGSEVLPELEALYIGGGFPETHAMAIAANESFRESVRRAVDEGLPVYAECGGLMFLGESISQTGRQYPMAGVLPLRFKMHRRPHAHGYTALRVGCENPFYAEGTVLKGHEFHYSEPMGGEKAEYAFDMSRGQGIHDGHDGILHKNVLATYTHLHSLGSPEWAEGMLRAAIERMEEKG